MAQPDETLQIHVIGAGVGESIILRFAGGHVGVIDCFCPKLRAGGTRPKTIRP